jgi:hypothetical protein
VLIIGKADRFQRGKQVASYLELVPLEKRERSLGFLSVMAIHRQPSGCARSARRLRLIRNVRDRKAGPLGLFYPVRAVRVSAFVLERVRSESTTGRHEK